MVKVSYYCKKTHALIAYKTVSKSVADSEISKFLDSSFYIKIN